MKKILIVEARFYPEISDLLLNGAKNAIESYGVLENGNLVRYLEATNSGENFYKPKEDFRYSPNGKAPEDIRLQYDIVNVMGALEIPAVISYAIQSKKYIGFIALGCVIRGETSHYDIVANESAQGLMTLSLKKHAAIGNAILTVENKEQAIVRADPSQKNKGGFAVEACISMIELQKQFDLNDK